MIAGKTQKSVLVVSASEKSIAFLKDMFDPRTYTPIDSVGSSSEARRALLSQEYDLVVINAPLSDEFGHDLALHITETTSSGVLLLVENDIYEEICHRVENFGIMTISKPLSRQLFTQTTKILAAMNGRLNKAEKEKQKLQFKMEELRLVTRAKFSLMQYLHMTEAQAHRYIEKQAMDMRITKKAVAESILKTYES